MTSASEHRADVSQEPEDDEPDAASYDDEPEPDEPKPTPGPLPAPTRLDRDWLAEAVDLKNAILECARMMRPVEAKQFLIVLVEDVTAAIKQKSD